MSLDDSAETHHAVVRVLRDLVVRHLNAARSGDRSACVLVCRLVDDLEAAYPFSAGVVLGMERTATQTGTPDENISIRALAEGAFQGYDKKRNS
jgi:hypothetical protein